MDSEKGNRVFARGAQCAPPLVFGAQKKPGLDRVKEHFGHTSSFVTIDVHLKSTMLGALNEIAALIFAVAVAAGGLTLFGRESPIFIA